LEPLDELADFLSGNRRAIVVSDRDVDLKDISKDNRIFVLCMVQGSLAAGGRGGGIGERTVSVVSFFKVVSGKVEKVYGTEEREKIERFEIPFYVARIPMTLRDGTEMMGYGVVEPELVDRYVALLAP